jgi:hypothetical protein
VGGLEAVEGVHSKGLIADAVKSVFNMLRPPSPESDDIPLVTDYEE